MIKELDVVVTKKDLPEYGLKAGDVGTVVAVHEQGQACEVEFLTLDGNTVGVVTLAQESIRAAGKGEIAHVRKVAEG